MPPVDRDAKIPCPTPHQLHQELETLTPIFELPEKEETWEKHEAALIRLSGLARGGAYKHVAPFVEGIGRQGLGLRIAACMMSDRGKLSGTAIDFVQTIAPRLGGSFAPLVSVYFDPLIRLLGRPNKVVQKRVDKCLITIISHCHLASIVLELRKGLSDEAVTCRRGCASVIEKALEAWDIGVWGEKGVLGLEDVIRKAAADKDAAVRQIGKSLWGLFSEQWPERVEEFSAPLTPITRRRLDIAAAAGPSKGKAPARNMGPPAAPHRPVAAALPASSSTAHLPKPSHSRNASASSHMASTIPNGEPSRRIPVASAPTSPTKERHDLPPLAKSISVASRPEGLGAPSRTVSSYHVPTSHRLGSPERGEARSKPSRPHIPSSYSAVSLHAEPAEPPAPRRFPPPSRALRPLPPSSTESDDMVFTSSSSGAGPSGLGGPARIPQPPAPIVSRLGPAVRPIQRRVVTAPTPHSSRQPLSATPSQTELATVLQGSKIVKKRVSQLEEEIRTIGVGGPSSPVPVVTRSPHGSYFSHISPSVLKSQRTGPMDSPLLPVLMRSTSSRPVEENEDLRAVTRERGDMSMALETPMDGLPTTHAAEHGPEGQSQDDGRRVNLIDLDESTGEIDPEVLVPVHASGADSDDLAQLFVGLGVAAPNVGDIENSEDAHQPNGIVQEDVGEPDKEEDMEEDAVIEKENEEGIDQPVREEIDNAKAAEERRQSALHIPLPSSPVKESMSLPEVAEEEPEAEAAVIPPPAVYPKEPLPRPRLLAQTTGSKAKIVEAKPMPARKAAVPRKPPVPPPPARARAPVAVERKTFKPTTAAARATVQPPTAVVAVPSKAADKPTIAKEVPKTYAALHSSTNTKSTVPADVAPSRTTAKASAAPRVGLGIGKSSAAPAVVARSVSAASASTASTKGASSIPPKPPVPKASSVKAPITSKVEVAKTTKPPIPPMTASTTASTRTAKPHAAVTIPPVRAEKLRRKAPLPSFKPTKGKPAPSIMGKGTVSTGRAPLKVSTTLANTVARVKPESVPLPLSPGEKAKLPPKDIPLPRSPVRRNQGAVGSQHEEVEVGKERRGDVDDQIPAKDEDVVMDVEKEVPQIQRQSTCEDAQEKEEIRSDNEEGFDAEEEVVEDEEEEEDEVEEVEEKPGDRFTLATATRPISIPFSPNLASPGTFAKSSSLKSSPILVSLPRALSPVLTTDVPPESPSPTSRSFGDIEQIAKPQQNGHAHAAGWDSPVAGDKLVDAGSPGDIPSPFLRSALQYTTRTIIESPYASSHFISKATTRAPPSDSDTESEEDLDGISTNLGRGSRGDSRSKKTYRVEEVSASLVELSASSRPAHGERKDVSTPIKGAEVLLAKLVGGGVNGTPKSGQMGTPSTRSVLSARDANRSGSGSEGAEVEAE